MIVDLIAMEIIEKCNLYCDFCVRNARRDLKGKLSLDQFRKRIDVVKGAFPSLSQIALTGGEPFLHNQLLQFLETIKEQGSRSSITTNGTVLNPALLEKIRSLDCCHFMVSLDGPSAEIHDRIRELPGAFQKTIQFIKFIGEIDIPFFINMTVNEKNYLSAYQTCALAYDLGARDISVALVKPQGRGKPINNVSSVFVEVGRQFLLAKRDFEPEMSVSFTDPLAHIFDVSLIEEEDKIKTCGAGGSSLHIQCNGTVLLCTSCDASLGNIEVLGPRLREVVAEDRRLQCILEREPEGGIQGACGSCEFNHQCGGCRCRSSVETGFLGSDPLCPKVKSVINQESINSHLKKILEELTASNAKSPLEFERWFLDTAKHLDKISKEPSSTARWFHNFDFGKDLSIDGPLGRRDLNILKSWIRSGEISLNLSGLNILDIGPGLGKEPLLLAKLGACVDVCEESSLYRETLRYLANQFDLKISLKGASIYDLKEAMEGKYDVVYFCGVLSHLSDMIVALRITYNCLKDGGKCLLETQTSYLQTGADEFVGDSRDGFVWNNPSRLTLLELLRTVGYEDIRVIDFDKNRRLQLSATRHRPNPLPFRVGLSHSEIK
ncbi:MAG: radical SAM protein [Deltaproteobacteria bacterium]|nr:radical SAM protein [Deltaproteobacteria bacterium]